MISFWRIFSLEWKALARSKTTAMLVVAAVAWMLVLPQLVTDDGTAAGARELYLHYSLGGVFALLVVALVSSATGSLASERTAKRLQLTLTRPVSRFSVALGKILAHVLVGALVLAAASAILLFKCDSTVSCNHVLSPVLPSPREEAKEMYAACLKNPETPPQVKKAKKSSVLRMLEQRVIDSYQTIRTNETASWNFACAGDAVRIRFSNPMEMRQDVRGVFRSGDAAVAVSNITQAIVTVPLRGTDATVSFKNDGKNALMMRPRRDINLLVAGDAFWRNLLRTDLELISILAILVSFGMVLSAGLGRPVAVFVAFVMLVVGEMSPSVIEQYPNELEANFVDRIGLAITETAADLTRPVSAMAPLASLSKDECVEAGEAVRLVLADLVVAPIAFSLLAAFLMPRKQDDLV